MGSPKGSGNDTDPITNQNPISDFAHGDTQPFDSPSQLHDKFGDDDWDASDWQWLQNTVPFDDTFPVEDNFGTQELNFGAETQVLDNLDCFEDVATQLVDDFDQIVNDSDGEGSDRTEILDDDDNIDDELRSGECDSVKREKSLCSPVRENNEEELIAQTNMMTAKPRISGSAPRFTSVRAASLRAAGLAARNSAFKVMKNNESNTKCFEEVEKGCDAMISHKEVKESSNGNSENRCPSAVRELLTENLSSETQGLNDKNDSTGGREEVPQFSHFDGGFAGLSYVDSQEPGESSQADALACVQRLIDESKELFDNDLDQGKSRVSNCTSNVKGPQSLAKKFVDKSINGKPGIFDWDDEREDEGGGDILHRRKEEFFGRRNLVGRFLTNPQKSKEKSMLQNEKVAHSDSKLILHNTEAIEKAAKENGTRRNLASEFNEHSHMELLSRQSDATLARNNVPEMQNVGMDTQIAAEAMEALFHGEGNANNNANDAQQLLPGNSMDSSKRHQRGKTSGSKECFANNNWDIGVATRKSKRKKSVVAMSGKSTLITSHKNCENHEKEFCSNQVTRSQRANSNSKKFVVITGRKIMKKVTSKSENIAKLGETTEKPQLNEPALSRDQTVNKQRLVEKFATFTPIARRTRRNSLEVSQLKNAENVVSGSEAADRPRPLVLGVSVEAFNALTDEGKFSELGSYPRKKRSLRDFSDQHKKPDNLSVQSKPEDTISISRNKRPRGNAGITIADSNTKRITRSSTSRDLSHQNRNLEGEVYPQVVDKPVSSDTTNGQNLSTNLKGRKAIGHLDRNSDRVPRLAKANIHLSSPGKAGRSSEPACTPPAGCVTANATSPACVTPVHAVSPICAGDGYVTPSCKKNLSRSSLMRESNSLCFTPEPPSPNDSRKRRDLASIRILFSHHLDDDIIKQQKKIADRLKVQVVSSITDATHFITDNFVRTRNMLEAIASGKPIVTYLWLEDVGQANYYIDEHKYILRDTKKEKELGFNMICSLAHARQNPLLQGRRVLITPNVKPGKEIISSLVKAVYGQAVERVGRSTLKDNLDSDDLLILSCEEDYQLCVPFLEKGASVYSSELLLNGIVIQKLEYERHRLFADHVKRTRSTMWLKKDGNNFIPVTRK